MIRILETFTNLESIFKYFSIQIQNFNFFCNLMICLYSFNDHLIIVNQIVCYKEIVMDNTLLSFLILWWSGNWSNIIDMLMLFNSLNTTWHSRWNNSGELSHMIVLVNYIDLNFVISQWIYDDINNWVKVIVNRINKELINSKIILLEVKTFICIQSTVVYSESFNSLLILNQYCVHSKVFPIIIRKRIIFIPIWPVYVIIFFSIFPMMCIMNESAVAYSGIPFFNFKTTVLWFKPDIFIKMTTGIRDKLSPFE